MRWTGNRCTLQMQAVSAGSTNGEGGRQARTLPFEGEEVHRVRILNAESISKQRQSILHTLQQKMRYQQQREKQHHKDNVLGPSLTRPAVHYSRSALPRVLITLPHTHTTHTHSTRQHIPPFSTCRGICFSRSLFIVSAVRVS